MIRVPLAAIADDLIPRDRSLLDTAALAELAAPIAADGLRQPVELLPFEEPDADGHTHALLSGFRRLTAFRQLHADFPASPDFAAIPALERPLAGPLSDALRLMVEENDIRADIAPWDQARIAVESVPGFFPTTDAAVAALYPHADRSRRARIRAACCVVEDLGHVLREPHALTLRRLERLAAACRGGFTSLIEVALRQSTARTAAAQWAVLETVLLEAEREARAEDPPDPRPGRPRRYIRPREGLWIRRERTQAGWCLRFTGPEASGALMEDIMDMVERMVGR
jgi:ParB family chromosome partitioning protein